MNNCPESLSKFQPNLIQIILKFKRKKCIRIINIEGETFQGTNILMICNVVLSGKCLMSYLKFGS